MSSFRKFYRPPIAARSDQEEVHGAYKKKIDPSYLDQEGRGTLHLSLMHQPEDPAFVEHVIRVGGCEVNAPDKNGSRPVAYAARIGAVRSLRVLILHGGKLDDLDSLGLSALMVAVSNGQFEALEHLLRSGATVNLTNDKGESALHYAVGAGDENCVRSLLKYGCRINQRDKDGQTVLHIAARMGNDSMLNTLITFHCHGKVQINLQDDQGRTAVHWSVDSRSLDCLQVLLQHGADPSVFDRHHNTPLLLAIKGNKASHVISLLEASARRTTIDGRSLVPLAALLGHTHCVHLLLDSGLSPNLSGHFNQSPLICAAFECCLDILELLLNHGANPNGLTHTLPLFAAMSCISKDNASVRHAIIAKLLCSGADPNIKFSRSWHYHPTTKSVIGALSLAFASGYTSLVRMLLLAGCTISISEYVRLMNDDQSQDEYDRNDLLEPIGEFLSQPPSLAQQIRLLIRKTVGPGSIQKKIETLPIAPALVNYLKCDELLYFEPEPAKKLQRTGQSTLTPYHPFREGQHIGDQDISCRGELDGTLLYKTLLSQN